MLKYLGTFFYEFFLPRFKANKCICESKKLNMTSPVTNICGL